MTMQSDLAHPPDDPSRLCKPGKSIQLGGQPFQLVRRISSLHITVMAPAGQVHREHSRGLSGTWTHFRQAIDLYPEIIPPGRGEPGADEQVVAVLGKHLRDDLQVLVERCDLGVYADAFAQLRRRRPHWSD
jgi:hypothetical protein